MNLPRQIIFNNPTKLTFKAVSDIAESNELTLELAWDGKWEQGFIEMKNHMIIKEVSA